MKHKRIRWLGALLASVVSLTSLPATALAEEVIVSIEPQYSGTTIDTSDFTDGEDVARVLDGYTRLILNGNKTINSLDLTGTFGVENVLEIEGSGTLTISSGGMRTQEVKEIRMKSGTIKTTGNDALYIMDSNFYMEGGTIDAETDMYFACYIQGNLYMNGGTLRVGTTVDGPTLMHIAGSVIMTGGKIHAVTDMVDTAGISASQNIVIKGGEIRSKTTNNGMEANGTFTMTDGVVNSESTDFYGLMAGVGTTISGGKLTLRGKEGAAILTKPFQMDGMKIKEPSGLHYNEEEEQFVDDAGRAATYLVLEKGEAAAPKKYTVTALLSVAGKATATPSVASPGETVTLRVTDIIENYEFERWEVLRGGVVISDPGKATATFVMPDADVEVRAHMKYNDTPTGGGVSGGGSSSGNTSVAGTWKRAKNGKYWYDLGKGKYPASKWLQVDGKWYYFDKSGYMVSGWKKINKKWYYFGGKKDGAMKTGWKKIGGKWYYLTPKTGAMVTGWKKIGGDWYYMDKKSGAMKTGWLKDGGKWYYMDKNGVMVKNTTRKIGKKTYRFDKNGVWVK